MLVHIDRSPANAVHHKSDRHGLVPYEVDVESLTDNERAVLVEALGSGLSTTVRCAGVAPNKVFYANEYPDVLSFLRDVVAARAERAAKITQLEHDIALDPRAFVDYFDFHREFCVNDNALGGIAAAHLANATQELLATAVREANAALNSARRKATDEAFAADPLCDLPKIVHLIDGKPIDAAPFTEEQTRERDRLRAEAILAAKAEATEARNAWIDAHGSERLKLAAKHNVECRALFRNEWLAWAVGCEAQFYQNVPWHYSDARNPPLDVLQTFDEVTALPAVRSGEPTLQFVARDEDDGVDDPFYVASFTMTVLGDDSTSTVVIKLP